jgi:hypothetical protein
VSRKIGVTLGDEVRSDASGRCVLAAALCAWGLGCGAHGGGDAGPSIEVDAGACEANLETLFATDGGDRSFIEAIAVGPDATIYFATTDEGIYALSPTDHTTRLIVSPADPIRVGSSTQLWVDGSTLIIQSDASFYAIPTSGDGTPQLIGQLPAPQPLGSWFTQPAAMDATDFYLAAGEDLPDTNAITGTWRVPREGGAPQLISTVGSCSSTPMILDGDTLYMSSGDNGQLFALPTSGGEPTAVDGVFAGCSPFAVEDGEVFAAPVGALTRYSLDGGAATAIGGVDGQVGYATRMIGDDQGAYVALWSSPAADANGNCSPPACSLRLAIAPLPLQDEHVAASACTAPWTLGATGDDPWVVPSQMALDSSYVYVLANVSAYPSQVILRAPRSN